MAPEVLLACSDNDLGCRCALFRLLFVEGRRPGVRPGGRGTFLCFAKEKYPKERRPEVRATSWFPALLAPGGVSLNSLRSNRREPFIRPSLRCSPCPTGGGEREPTAAAAQRRRVVSIGGRGCVAARGHQCSARQITQLPTSVAECTGTADFVSALASSPAPDPVCPVGQGRAAE